MNWLDGAIFIVVSVATVVQMRILYRQRMSAGELRVKLDLIHQSLHLAILHNRKLIMATQDQIDALTATLGTVSTSLTETGATLTKADAEIVAEIQALKDQIAHGTPPDFTALEAKAAGLSTIATALSTAAKSLDDLNQDAAP